jgi:hypothetical protein
MALDQALDTFARSRGESPGNDIVPRRRVIAIPTLPGFRSRPTAGRQPLDSGGGDGSWALKRV